MFCRATARLDFSGHSSGINTSVVLRIPKIYVNIPQGQIVPHYESEDATVHWNTDLDAVILDWNGFVKGAEFKEPMDATLDLLAERGGSKLLADSSEMETIDQDDQEWSLADWAPRAQEAGLDHLVVIYPESVVAAMSVDSVMDAANDDIERHVTDDREEAEAWIAER